MKRLINYSVILLTLTIFAGTMLAQSDGANGKQNKIQNKGQNTSQSQWVDINGDGICDNFGTENQGQGRNGKSLNKGNKNGNLSGNGSGNGDGSGLRPQDGTGFGRGNGSGTGNGTGVCDGTGPKGSGRKNGNK